jgi:hypothetical protein
MAAHIVTSANSGATWGLSNMLMASDWVDSLGVRVAVSNDPLYFGKKLVHALWSGGNATGTGSLYYAYKANRPNLTGWSAPVEIGAATDPMSNNLMVTSNGVIHIISSGTYASAASPDSAFTVIPLPIASMTTQAVMDSTGNLYAVDNETTGAGLFLMKKSNSSSTWVKNSTPIVSGGAGPYFSLAVADANTYYVAYHDGTNLCLSVTTNGGASWTKRTVVSNTTSYNTNYNPAIAVTSGKVLTYVTELFDSAGNNPVIKVFRTSDNGVTWSAPATIKGQATPSIALDSTGKAHILVRDELGDWTGNTNLLWIKEK